MIFDLLCQGIPELPQSNPGEWGKWIIAVLIIVIVSLVWTIKWIIDKVFTKVDEIIKDIFGKVDKLEAKFETMHKEATNELKSINSSLLQQSNKMESFATDLKETKYAIQNINCANEDIKVKRKVS